MPWFPLLKNKDILTIVLESLSEDWRSLDDISYSLHNRGLNPSKARVAFSLRKLVEQKVVEKKFVLQAATKN